MTTDTSTTIDISFELFPPKTDAGMEKLKRNVERLTALRPAYFSVTYGAGGSTQEEAIRLSRLIGKDFVHYAESMMTREKHHRSADGDGP